MCGNTRFILSVEHDISRVRYHVQHSDMFLYHVQHSDMFLYHVQHSDMFVHVQHSDMFVLISTQICLFFGVFSVYNCNCHTLGCTIHFKTYTLKYIILTWDGGLIHHLDC